MASTPKPIAEPPALVAARAAYGWSGLRHDAIAGLTVAAIAAPQAMAYALIAGVEPRYGLYAAIVVTAVGSIFGSSSFLINGPTNAISLVVFSALAFLNAAANPDPNAIAEAMFLLAVMVGVIQIAIALFKLGDLTRYISESVVLGFMAGAGVLIALSQVANVVRPGRSGQRSAAPAPSVGADNRAGRADQPARLGDWIGRDGLDRGAAADRPQIPFAANRHAAGPDRGGGLNSCTGLVGAGWRRQAARCRGGECSRRTARASSSRIESQLVDRNGRQRGGDCGAGLAGSALDRQIAGHPDAAVARLQPPMSGRGLGEFERGILSVHARLRIADSLGDQFSSRGGEPLVRRPIGRGDRADHDPVHSAGRLRPQGGVGRHPACDRLRAGRLAAAALCPAHLAVRCRARARHGVDGRVLERRVFDSDRHDAVVRDVCPAGRPASRDRTHRRQ